MQSQAINTIRDTKSLTVFETVTPNAIGNLYLFYNSNLQNRLSYHQITVHIISNISS